MQKALAKNKNLTGMSVLGRYVGTMRLKKWNEYRYADTERLQKEYEEGELFKPAEQDEAYEEELKRQLESGEITEAQYKTLSSVADNEAYEEKMKSQAFVINKDAEPMPRENFVVDANVVNDQFYPDAVGGPDDRFAATDFIPESELVDPAADLTHEDKVYLATKWGRFYRPAELVMLEQDYVNYMDSFDIHDADTKNGLKTLCKVNLKADQALDSGDYDSFQKLAKQQTDLRKTMKFTASQAKEEEKDFVDSVGELVSYCERYGGVIPKIELDAPLDYVDVEMKDTQDYLRTLVYEDPTLANVIESYIRKRNIAQEMAEDQENAILEGKDGVEVTAEDYLEFSDSIIEQQKEDLEVE